MNTASRSAFAALLFSLAPACATDPVSVDPEPTMEDPQPEPTPDPQPDPTPDPTPTPLASGELDPTFGVGGVKALDEVGDGYYAAGIAAQGQQLIACISMLAGNSMQGQVVRLNTDGSVDATFGNYGTFNLNLNGMTHTACSGVAVLDDRIAVTVTNLDTSVRTLVWIAADGKTMYPSSFTVLGNPTRGGGTQSGKVSAGASDNGKLGVASLEPGLGSFSYTGSAMTGTPTRAFVQDANAFLVGSFDTNNDGKREWATFGRVNNVMQLMGNAASMGDPAVADLMLDAALLPDGTVVAVGGIDTGKEVLAARFTPDGADMEHHSHGGVSMARGIVLDSANRPVVVGNATSTDGSIFGWQRYDVSGMSGITLDTNYRESGLASVAPPSGQGELVGAARIGNTIYALGQYDVEKPLPKLALVKIAD